MGKRKRQNWHQRWQEEQTEPDVLLFGEKVSYTDLQWDWRDVPVARFHPSRLGTFQQVFIVQTCNWREDWDECACWWPADGTALCAFTDLADAQERSRQFQEERKERCGVVEFGCDSVGDALYLVKERPRWYRPDDEESGVEGEIVAAFGIWQDAERDRLAREKLAWENTCRYGLFPADATTMPEEILRDVFYEIGVTPIPWKRERPEAISKWWKQTGPLLDLYQREYLFRVMDRFCRFRIVKVPFTPASDNEPGSGIP